MWTAPSSCSRAVSYTHLDVYKRQSSRNPDVLKAERFFKERRIPYQLMDLKKHRLGKKELEVFAAAAGAKALVDRSGKKALERPVAHMSTCLLYTSRCV